jgi:hypothetical protein
MNGEPLSSDLARGKVVVMHLASQEEICLANVTSSGAAELVVGMSVDGQPANQ